MAPVLPPAQGADVITKLSESSLGSVKVILVVVEQPFVSLTITEYNPAATPVKSSIDEVKVLGPLQVYVYAGLPPLTARLIFVVPP